MTLHSPDQAPACVSAVGFCQLCSRALHPAPLFLHPPGHPLSPMLTRVARLATAPLSLLLAQLALHNPHIWANSLKPVCFLCFLLFWCPLLPFIETGTLKIYTKMVLYMKNEFLTSNTPSMGFEPTLYQP